MLTCPICHRLLELSERTWRCPEGHAFDRAREGYVDLLPVGHGRSGITGDTAPMVRARKRFLERGHYAPLVERILARVRRHLEESAGTGRGPAGVVAEAGCGVGHYIGAVAGEMPGAACYGFDVSRDALRLAARTHPGVTFAVNDVNHGLCLPDAAADVLLDIFAPRNAAEFRRLLGTDGLLLVVVPGEDHLRELRARYPLLSIAPEKRVRTREQLAPRLALEWAEPLEWTAELDAADVADLLAMTPSAFHLPEGTAAKAEGASVTLSFSIMGFTATQPGGARAGEL